MSSSTASPVRTCDYEECDNLNPQVHVTTHGLSFIQDGEHRTFCSEACLVDWLEKHDSY